MEYGNIYRMPLIFGRISPIILSGKVAMPCPKGETDLMNDPIQPATEPVAPDTLPRLPRPEPRKKRRKDRREGRYLRTLYAMNKFMPYIMPERSDGCNTYADELDVTGTDSFCKDMIRQGYKNFSFLHVMLAAYIRTISQKPGINRFVAGQRIYARNNIEIVMTVKKEMTSDSPDTCIKVIFEPDDTIAEVYEKFNAAVEKVKSTSELDSGFDKTAEWLANLPRPILRAAICMIRRMDYHGHLPQSLLDVSPFHGSMIITSMGSLGIKPIYHHIYNFGTLPVFISYGVKRTVQKVKRDGTSEQRKYIDLKVVTDERICDGFYYASAFKLIRRYAEHPELLTVRPTAIVDDVE